MKIGICTSVVNGNLLEAAGADFVEENVQGFLVPLAADEEFARHRRDAVRSPVPVLAANCFLPATMKCVGPAVDVAAIDSYARQAFARAAQLGIKFIVFGSGGARQIPEGVSRADATEQFVTLVQRLAPLAAAAGVTVVVEPLNKAECNFINSLAEGAAIVERCHQPQVRLLADIYHMMRDDQPPSDLVECGRWLAHVHIAEKEHRTAPGKRGDDFRPYLRALRQTGYDGGIAIECNWSDLAAEAAASVRYLRQQLAACGQP